MTRTNSPGASTNEIVPARAVHTSVVFLVWAVTGAIALVAGIIGAVRGSGGAGDIPGWAALMLTYGALGVLVGGIVTPTVIRIARHDRITLAMVRSRQPTALIVPGAASNRELVDSLRAFGRGPSKPKSYLLSFEAGTLSMWQFDSPSPVFTLGWADITSMETGSMPQGRATISIAKLSVTDGRLLTIALRRRFGGITLMGQDQLYSVLAAFEAGSR